MALSRGMVTRAASLDDIRAWLDGDALPGWLAPTNTDPGITISRSLTGAGNAHGFTDESLVNKTGTIGYNSYDAQTRLDGTQAYDHMSGFQFRGEYAADGAIDRLTGFQSLPTTVGTVGTITRVTGFEMRDILGGAATITTQVALYIEALTRATTNYGVFLLNEPNGGSIASDTGIDITLIGGGTNTVKIPSTAGIALVDGQTAPTAVVGEAHIFVDTADGDLKVRFGDGFTAVIAADA